MDVNEKIKELVSTLAKKKMQIALAESCTGGYVSHNITNISGASRVFERGVVTYSNQSKIDMLNVDPRTLQEHGAVSDPVARQMAENLRKISNVDISVSTTGIAGPTGATPGKPIGLVYIGFSTEKGTIVKEFTFKSSRIGFKEKVLEEILLYLDSIIKKNEKKALN